MKECPDCKEMHPESFMGSGVCGHCARRHREAFVNAVAIAPPPSLRESDHDVSSAIRFLEYARKNGYRVGPIKIGSLEVQVEDVRLDDLEKLKPHEHQPRNIWADAGFADPIPGDGTVG